MSLSLSRSHVLAWMMWIAASVFYAYQYVLRVMPNIMLGDIMERFHIDAALFGQFSGVYYLGYSLMHLPIGILLDRVGPRKVMSLCAFITGLGLLPLILAEHWAFPLIGRFFIGLGSSGAILGVFKIIRMAFEEKRFARMLSLSVMVGLVGAIYGGRPVDYLLTSWGYSAVIYTFIAMGWALAAATYWMVPEIPRSAKSSVLTDIKAVFSNSKVLLCCFCAGLMVGPLEGFADVWGTAFLTTTLGIDRTTAATLPSLIFIGMCFGSPLLSLIAEKSRHYLLTIVAAGVAMALSFVLLLSQWVSAYSLCISFLIVGVSCAYQILAIYKASTYVEERVAGLTTAVANMIIMVFGYAFHSMIGGIVQSMGGPSNPEALSYGIAVIPITLILGSIGFSILFFKEKTKGVA